MKRFSYANRNTFQADMQMSACTCAPSFTTADDFLLILGTVFAVPFFVIIRLCLGVRGLIRLCSIPCGAC